MAEMLKAKVTIRGTRVFMYHHFGPDSIPLERKERTGVAGNDPEEWKRTVLATPSGQLYIEPSYIFCALRDGGQHIKRGMKSLRGAMGATLQVLDTRILIKDRRLPNGLQTPPPTDPDAPVYLDVRSVVNPGTRGRNLRYRVAMSPGWECAFTIQWDASIVNREEMQKVVRNAGALEGIGSGRGIGMGRFEMALFQIVEE